jgi:hypothetical protein
MTLTTSQITWASEHDWFVRDNGDGTITVADRYSDGPKVRSAPRPYHYTENVRISALDEY